MSEWEKTIRTFLPIALLDKVDGITWNQAQAIADVVLELLGIEPALDQEAPR